MPHLFDSPLAVVDVETTGINYRYGGVIDIGVLRIEGGQVVSEFRQLIRPTTAIPSFITQLTGISNDDVVDAPVFADIAGDLDELLADCVFVAHNARFDYAFIKEEFKRTGRNFQAKTFCTVKLSRALYPSWPNHKLSTLITQFKIEVAERHRAYDDALATWQALQKMMSGSHPDVVETLTKQQLKRPSLPQAISQKDIEILPEGPGVYIFEGQNGATLYVGKSVTIRDRVLSHFADDHRSTKELKLAQEVTSIRTVSTPGELGALLKESQLIKQLLPLYNRMLRRQTELVVAARKIDDQGYPTIKLIRGAIIVPDSQTETGDNKSDQIVPVSQVLSSYKSEREAKESLVALAKEYRLCQKLLGLEKTSGACFGHHLKVCQGACVGKEIPISYQLRFDQAFAKQRLQSWPYPGPMLLTERDEDQNQATSFVIDQWRLIGIINQRDQEVEFEAQSTDFDLDTYKILKRFLTNKGHQLHIQPAPVEFMQLS